MIFDSHCHPQFPQYDADRGEMLARARVVGVSMICVGTGLETSKSGIELAQKHEGIWATVGIHPNDADSLVVNQVGSLVGLLGEPKVVAVGEIGLDYYRTEGAEAQKKQKDLFIAQLELAKEANLPVILHARDASKGSTGRVHADMLSILETYNVEHKTGSTIHVSSSTLRGVVHSFTGTVEEAKKYLELGFYVGFNGIITFAPQYDDVVRSVPLDRILLETDAPYLTPEPYRGKRNEPYFVTLVVDKLAALKGVSKDEVILQTTKNCIKLFGLD